eukprot:373167-Hanusia_phi.AAC.2
MSGCPPPSHRKQGRSCATSEEAGERTGGGEKYRCDAIGEYNGDGLLHADGSDSVLPIARQLPRRLLGAELKVVVCSPRP